MATTDHRPAQLPASAPASRESVPGAQAPEEPGPHRPWDRISLLWRVFATNAVVFVAAVALLAWAPVTVHRVATPSELVILAVGLVVTLAVDLVLLRRTFAPLRRLAALMGAVDPVQPGRRADAPRGAGHEVLALARALNAMLDRLEGERRESARRALAAQEAERARVARELHDEVGQTLTAIALRAERAAAEPAGATQVAALTEIAETVLHSLDGVRRIGRELRPEALDDLGLVNALIALCSRAARDGGISVHRELTWQLPQRSAEAELVIYRVAQEALTNVLRHAGASEVTVSLRPQGTSIVLAVRDNGSGIPDEASEHGLAGMRERAMLVGGEVEITSSPDLGTEIVLRVPAAPPAAPAPR